MRISELLNAMASWLEDPNNEAILLAEYDEDCLKVVAQSCVEAAITLKKAAEEVDLIEPLEDSKITSDSVEELANLASVLDSSQDPELMKQAAVLDELLLTIAAPPNALAERKDLQDQRLVELKKKYEQPRKDLEDSNKIADSQKAIEKSQMTKQYKIMEAPLSTRYCPIHAGVQLARVGQSLYQCELDKKVFDYENGYTLENGDKVPGGDVANQTQSLDLLSQNIFDTREGRLNQNK